MTLHSPRFEQALRRGVKERVRHSLALKREFRRANRVRRHSSLGLVIRTLLSVGVAVMVWVITYETGHPTTALAFVSLWAFMFVCIHAHGLLSVLYHSTDLSSLFLLPITERTIFRWEMQKFLGKALRSLLDLLFGYGALALLLEFSKEKWIAILLVALLTWALSLALAFLATAFRPKFPYNLVFLGILLVILPLALGWNVVGDAVLAALDRAAPTLILLLPTGWPATLFQLLLGEGDWLAVGLLVPMGAVIWTLGGSWARLQSYYRFEEAILAEAPDLVPGVDLDTALASETASTPRSASDPPRHLGPTAITEIVESRQFFQSPPWHKRGWMENLLWRWCSQREKVLIEFVFPQGVALSGRWIRITRNLSLAILAAVLSGWANRTLEPWILGIGLFIVSCQALVQLFGTGRAFRPVRCSGFNIPTYAVCPIGYRELSRLLFKCSWIQLTWFLPFTLAASTFVALVGRQPLLNGILFGAKTALLLMAARFIALVWAFSSGTNDGSKFRLRTLGASLVLLASAGLFLVLGVASLFPLGHGTDWALLAVVTLDAYAFFRIYGWYYHANQFDLMSIPRQ